MEAIFDHNLRVNWSSLDNYENIEERSELLLPTYEALSATATSDITNETIMNSTNNSRAVKSDLGILLESLLIPLYGTIFLLAVVGNSLVLITLARNKRMRTVTNIYLLNLAVSDLLLGMFCMPFTLLGQRLKNFVFGVTLCKLISYFQVVSVSVSVWTLVAISLERYFAICRPLQSRRWQTQFHAYKMIAVVWAVSLTANSPILVVSRLIDLHGGRKKCREQWPSSGIEQCYILLLDITLLLVPLIVMSMAYSLIAAKLWRGLRQEIRQTSNCQQRQRHINPACFMADGIQYKGPLPALDVSVFMKQSDNEDTLFQLRFIEHIKVERTESSPAVRNSRYSNADRGSGATIVLNTCTGSSRLERGFPRTQGCFHNAPASQESATRVRLSQRTMTEVPSGNCQEPDFSQDTRLRIRANGSGCSSRDTKASNAHKDIPHSRCPLSMQYVIRSNYMNRSIEAKKKVIRMLFVIVLEFFVCWAPIHMINTWYAFSPELVYKVFGSTGISLVQLAAYGSSCCNPITYCFMNRNFRQAFLGLFDCHRCWRVGCRNGDIAMAATTNAVQVGNNSEFSGNESTVYLGRASLVARSEVVRLLEEEDRV